MKKGQSAIFMAFLLLFLLFLGAALTDALFLLERKAYLWQVISSAALIGASEGRDWWAYIEKGEIRLDSPLACSKAKEEIEKGLGVECECVYSPPSSSSCQIYVLEEGGRVDGFPPGSFWEEKEPSVGIYLRYPVRAEITGLEVTISLFAAGSVASP
ncbi:MAG: hypothetical protein QXH03_00115 [Candidatus Bathyarchaeia archaeon]